MKKAIWILTAACMLTLSAAALPFSAAQEAQEMKQDGMKPPSDKMKGSDSMSSDMHGDGMSNPKIKKNKKKGRMKKDKMNNKDGHMKDSGKI